MVQEHVGSEVRRTRYRVRHKAREEVIPYLKMVQKKTESHDISLSSADISIFSQNISKF